MATWVGFLGDKLVRIYYDRAEANAALEDGDIDRIVEDDRASGLTYPLLHPKAQ